MTDDDCGCRCRDCAAHDIHSCGLEACGYTKYRKLTKPVQKIETVSEAVNIPALTAKFTSVRDPAARERLSRWWDYVQETAGLDHELREAKRRERYAEIFG